MKITSLGPSSSASEEAIASPGLPDRKVDTLPARQEKPQHKWKSRLKTASNAVKRYLYTPRAAYPHWEAYTPKHAGGRAVEGKFQSLYTSKLLFANHASDRKAMSVSEGSEKEARVSKESEFTLSEWRLVSEHKGQRVWVNDNGVRVREEDAWWGSLTNRGKRHEW